MYLFSNVRLRWPTRYFYSVIPVISYDHITCCGVLTTNHSTLKFNSVFCIRFVYSQSLKLVSMLLSTLMYLSSRHGVVIEVTWNGNYCIRDKSHHNLICACFFYNLSSKLKLLCDTYDCASRVNKGRSKSFKVLLLQMTFSYVTFKAPLSYLGLDIIKWLVRIYCRQALIS